MKIIVTTSDNYLHIVPIFCYLFNKFWSDKQPVIIVGYEGLWSLMNIEYERRRLLFPENFTFHSLGKQEGGANNFTRNLKEYFKKQNEWFVWMMEDTLIKGKVNIEKFQFLKSLAYSEKDVGKICLHDSVVRQKYDKYERVKDVYEQTQDSEYRLSTQPAIWNRDFLLKYMQMDLSPWAFELQPSKNDGYHILGLAETIIPHNEGVRRFDNHIYDFSGIDEKVINEMRLLNII